MRGNPYKQYRVLNLIRKVNLETASPKQRAVIGLLEWQPMAERIQFAGQCPQRGCKGLALSYQLPHMDGPRGRDSETCGYYCPACRWGNAGSRPIRQPKFNQQQKPGEQPGFDCLCTNVCIAEGRCTHRSYRDRNSVSTRRR